MDAAPTPITPELWQRMKALDRRCDCFMHRRVEWQTVGAGNRLVWSSVRGDGTVARRAWYVRISLRGTSNTMAMVDAISPALADALLTAVVECEKRGWHKPEGGNAKSAGGTTVSSAE